MGLSVAILLIITKGISAVAGFSRIALRTSTPDMPGIARSQTTLLHGSPEEGAPVRVMRILPSPMGIFLRRVQLHSDGDQWPKKIHAWIPYTHGGFGAESTELPVGPIRASATDVVQTEQSKSRIVDCWQGYFFLSSASRVWTKFISSWAAPWA